VGPSVHLPVSQCHAQPGPIRLRVANPGVYHPREPRVSSASVLRQCTSCPRLPVRLRAPFPLQLRVLARAPPPAPQIYPALAPVLVRRSALALLLQQWPTPPLFPSALPASTGSDHHSQSNSYRSAGPQWFPQCLPPSSGLQWVSSSASQIQDSQYCPSSSPVLRPAKPHCGS
jgi:hypothetical protein